MSGKKPAPLPPGLPPGLASANPRAAPPLPVANAGVPPLPPVGAAGDPRGRISARLAAFLPHRRRGSSSKYDANVDPETGEPMYEQRRRPSSVRQRISSIRHKMHLPHVLNPRGDPDHFEYAFEEEGASSEESDPEDTDSTPMAGSQATGSQVSERRAKKKGGIAAKVKGGIKGAGAAAAHKAAEKKVPQRMMLGFFAVCLLWITSYGVARAIVRSKITIPAVRTVTSRNGQAFAEGEVQRARYVECVNVLADECQADYDEEFNGEIGRRDAVKQANRDLLLQVAANLTVIENLYNTSRNTLFDLVDSGTYTSASLPVTGSGADECGLVLGIINGNEAAINALNAAQGFTNQAEGQVLSLALQIENRRIYDQEYFANKTAELNEMAARMQNNTFNFSATFEDLQGAVLEVRGCFEPGGTCPRKPVLQSLNESFTDGEAFFANLQTQSLAYKAQAQGQLNDYANLMSAVRNSLNDIQNALGFALGGSILRPASDANEPGFNPATFTIAGVAPFSEIAGPYEAIMGNLSAKLGVEGGILGDRSEAQRAAADGWQNAWDDDYDPPAVNTNDTLANMSSATAAFLPALSGKLEAFEAVTRDEREALTGSVNETARALNASSESLFVQLTNHSEWDFYAYGDEVLADVEGGLQDMSDIILVFDILFRLLYTLFVIRKYWKLTGLATPSGDARIKQDVGAGWGPKKTPLQKIAALATNPLVLTGLTCLTISLLLWAFWWAYSPLYYEYVDSCTTADFRDIDAGAADGTMLYRNGYEALFQFAASEGDALATERTDEINVGRDVTCTKQTYNDIVLFNAMVERWNQLLERYTQVVNQNNAFIECLNLTVIDGAQGTSLVFLTGNTAFSLAFDEPDPLAIYNCSVVTGCPAIRAVNGSEDSNLCEGPNEVALKSLGHRAACTSENWFHAWLFGSFMIVSCFILLNIGRIIVMRGLVRVLWRQVIVDNFSFLASCNDRGEIIYPERVTEKGDSMQVAIREALKKALRRWQLWGYAILVSGLLIQIPWIWGLYWLADNLEYKAS